MEDQLISFETAKLAKENGFKIPCYRHYNNEEELIEHSLANGSSTDVEFEVELDDLNENFNYYSNKFNTPTQSLLQKWFWEEYRIWIEITLWGDGIGFICVIKQAKGKEKDGSTIVKQLKAVDVGLACSEPSKALEKGLQEALKLI